MKIVIDDLSSKKIRDFLDDHINDMKSVSPPESKHALDLNDLKAPDITFWSVWDGDNLVGCGALKELDPTHAEIKSMRTSCRSRRKGVASQLLRFIISVAEKREYSLISLETGSMPFFEPARRLYSKFGFHPCDPFADYTEDPNSVYMCKRL